MSMKSIVSKYEPQDAKTYVGRVGEAWVDMESAALHIGDNVTEGGVVVRGTGNLLVQNDTIATQDNGEIFLNTGAAEVKMHAEHVAEEKTMQEHAIETVAMAHAQHHAHDAHPTGATGPAA